MEPVEQQRQPARRGLRRMAGGARDQRAPRPRPASAPVSATSSAIERCRRSGRSSQSAIQRGDAEQREADLEVDVAAAERRHPEQRHERAEGEHERSESTAVATSRYDRDRDQPEHRRRPRRRSRPRAGSSRRTRRTSGRAISIRSTNRPIAVITVRNIAQRAISSARRRRRLRDAAGRRTAAPGPGSGRPRT